MTISAGALRLGIVTIPAGGLRLGILTIPSLKALAVVRTTNGDHSKGTSRLYVIADISTNHGAVVIYTNLMKGGGQNLLSGKFPNTVTNLDTR